MIKTNLKVGDKLTQIKNYFTEKGGEVSEQIIALIEELANGEFEVDETMLIEELKKIVSPEVQEEVAAEVADAISKLNIKNTNTQMDTIKVKNDLASIIMNSHGRDDAMKQVKNYTVQNGVTFSSGDFSNPIVDYDIVNKWEDYDELWNALNFTQVSKFFYTTQEWDDANAKASLWTKASTDPKTIQALTLNPKILTTAYVYKRQRYAQEDLDDINESGSLAQFLDWTTGELRRHVIDMILGAILGTKSLSNIESIKSGNTAFTTVVTKSETVTDSFDYVTIENVREMVDTVIGRGDKWVVCTQRDFTRLAAHKHASGGTTEYWSKEEVASQLGVANIYVSDLIAEGRIVCFIPSEYWVKVKNTLNLAYPQYELNAQNLQYELNVAGAIHGLLSSAVLMEG